MEIRDLTRDINTLRVVVASIADLNKRTGFAVCPFHKDSNPSMHTFISSQTGKARYNCFSCGAHGDVIDFVRRTMGINFQQALAYISDITGKRTGEAPASSSLGVGGSETRSEKELLEDRYKELLEDYDSLLEENRELRKRLGMPDFIPTNEDPRLSELQRRISMLEEGLKNREIKKTRTGEGEV